MHKDNEALQYQLAATQLTEKLYGKDDEFYLSQISLLSDYYFIIEYTNLYYETCKEILTLSEKLYGSDSEQYAYALDNLSDYYSSVELGTSGAKKALEYALEAVEILYKTHKKVPLYVEKRLFWLYLQLDDKEEAFRLIKSIIKNTQKLYGNDSQEYADCLLCLSYTKEDEEEAKLLLDKSLQIIINQYGTDSKEYLEFLVKINDHEQTDSIRFSNALIIKDLTAKFYGKKSEDYAATLLDLTKILAYKNPQAAIKTLNEATQIYTTFDKNRMSYIKQYMLTAIELHFLLGNDVVAYELNNEAMELLKNLNPMYKESSTYFALLRNLAYYKNHIGEYEQTPEILSELINIEEKLGITQHDDIMLLFADTYTLLGKYEEATRIYNELYECIIQDETRFTKEYSTIADGMSSLYENLGDYDKSLFYAIESYKSSNDISTKGYELSQIGNIHYKLGNFKKAIEYLDMAIDNETEVYGYVTSVEIYLIKGEIYYKTKNYEEALRQYMLAKENIETQLGIENLNYAEILISIAKIHIKLNEYQTATNYRNQAKEIIYKINSGSKKYSYISALCTIDYDLNDEVSLKEDFQTVTDNYTKIIKTNFQNLSANERTLFWENYKDWFEEQSPKFAYTYNAQEFSTNAYNSILISKGLLLNSEIEFNNIIQESGDTIALKMYKELHTLKLLINKLRENPVSQLYTNIDSLEQIAQKQEKALVERSKDYGDYTQNLVITWHQVQSKLGKKDVAIEFVSFPLNADSTMYIAYVLRKGWQFPKIVKLFEEKQLKNIDTQLLYTSNQASRLVWQPLKELMSIFRLAENSITSL